MNPVLVIALVVGLVVLILVAVNSYMKVRRDQASIDEQERDRRQARSASSAEWATKVDVPDWADRGSAQVNKKNLPDGTSIGSSSGSFSFEKSKKDKSNSGE
ncbi:MAG: hypothetical protein IT205_09950 [Fimbriimonadaceae bacterium]|nr:hypothetical protein [Fimbriimonadaceae bacterium]